MDPQGGSSDLVQTDGSSQRETRTVAAAQAVSIDYQPIIETAIAALTDKAPDRRGEVYAQARGIVKRQLESMGLPEPIIELERLALDLTIGKIERGWQARETAERVGSPAPLIGPTAAQLAKAGPSPRLASPIGFTVALSIAIATLFGLYAESGVAVRSLVGGLAADWSSIVGGEPGTTADVGADGVTTEISSTQIAAMLAAACRSEPSTLENNACMHEASAGGTAGEASQSGSEPPWLSRFAAFSDITSGRATSGGPNLPAVMPEDNAAGVANPGGTLERSASPMSLDKALHDAASPPSAPSLAKPINTKVATLIESGKRATLRGDLDRAMRDFSDAIRIDPKYPDSYSERGQALFKLGEIERAIADYSAALARDPEHTAALRARGMAYLYRGRPDLALADLTKTIELGERDPGRVAPMDLFFARRSRSSIYGSRQQFDLEIADCTALIESYARNPTLADALAANYGRAGSANVLAMLYRQRANAFLRGSNLERAVADLTEAIPLSADHGYAALLDRSRLREQLGQLDLAVADAQAALSIQPAGEEAQLALHRLGAGSRPSGSRSGASKSIPGNGL